MREYEPVMWLAYEDGDGVTKEERLPCWVPAVDTFSGGPLYYIVLMGKGGYEIRQNLLTAVIANDPVIAGPFGSLNAAKIALEVLG